MAENKTQPTDIAVADYVAALEPERRRDDARAVCAMMARATGEAPVMWGPTMIGFGRYRYRYESGREGEIFRVGFAPRKPQLVFYIPGGFAGHDALMARLGSHTVGKGCLYVRTLAAIDPAVLEELVRAAWAHMAEAYPDA